MAYQRDITADDKVFYDTDRTLRYTIYEGDPTAEEILSGDAIQKDVTGWTIGWTLRRKPNSADPPLIEKRTDDGSPAGVTITGDFGGSPNTQRVEVRLHDTDTYDPDVSPAVSIKAGRYVYALKRLDEGSEGILAWGSLTLLQSAAWE